MTTGRYEHLEVATLTVPDGAGGEVQVRYRRRRFLGVPAPDAVPLAFHRIRRSDRLDLISETYLGDSTAFWMVADANVVLDADALTAADAEDNTIVIPMPSI